MDVCVYVGVSGGESRQQFELDNSKEIVTVCLLLWLVSVKCVVTDFHPTEHNLLQMWVWIT